MTEYFARKEYVYTGGDAIFSIPFSYIDKKHIKVYINEVKYTGFTYLNDTQIRIYQTLKIGDVVVVSRETPIDEKFVTFTDTSILSQKQQNLAQDQIFDAMQEVADGNTKFKIDTNNIIADFEDAVNDKVDGHIEESNRKFETLTNKVVDAQDSIENRAKEIINSIEIKGNNVANDVIANGQYWNEIVADHNLLYEEVVGDSNSIEIPSNQYVEQAQKYSSSASNSAQQAANSASSALADATRAANSAQQAANTYNNISKETTNSINSINSTRNSSINDINSRGQYWNDKVASQNLLYEECEEDCVEIATTHYVELAKAQADIATAKANEVVTNGNTAITNINTAKTNSITDINSAKNKTLDTIDTRGEYWMQRCAASNLFYEEVGNVDIVID